MGREEGCAADHHKWTAPHNSGVLSFDLLVYEGLLHLWHFKRGV